MEMQIEVIKLIKRIPEKETGYDKKINAEYWEYEYSDGTKGKGPLYQSQLAAIRHDMAG